MSVFDIFGDRTEVLQPKAINSSRVILGNENVGKLMSRSAHPTPVKPNEPTKRQENKKSFLSNKGAALQGTPLKPGTPFGKANLNTQPLKIYSEVQETEHHFSKDNDIQIELEFHKPVNQYDNFNRDIFDDMPIFSYPLESQESRAITPEPDIEIDRKMEFNYSYDDDFFKDDFSNDSGLDDLELPPYEF